METKVPSTTSTASDTKAKCDSSDLSMDPEFTTVDSDEVSLVELIPINESSFIYLDKDQSHSWWITNVKTLERHALDKQDWNMTCNPDTGRAIVWVTDQAGNIIDNSPVDSLLKKELVQRTDTAEILMVDDCMSRQLPLEQVNTRFREGSFEIKVGATAGSLKLAVYVFERPRATGTRFFVDLRSIFAALQLTQFKGIPSKWVYASKDRWLRQCGPMGVNAIVMGQDCSEKVDFQSKCLPFPSISLPMTFYLTMIWSSAPKNVGGFENHKHRDAAYELLVSLSNASLEHLQPRSHVVDFDLSPNWTCLWPRPQPPGDLLPVQLDSRGIHLQAFEPNSSSPNPHLIKLWTQAKLSQLLSPGGDGFVSVPLFTRALITNCLVVAKPILSQLAWFVADALELKSLLQVTGKFPEGSRGTSSKLELTTPADSFANKYMLAKAVNGYVASTRSCRSNWQNFTISTDKGDGGQLPLQQTAISFPDNMMIFAIPQAV